MVSHRPEWHAEREAFSHRVSRRVLMQWPSLWRDQGITLNPPDRCHMHVCAQIRRKQTKKNNWWYREWKSNNGRSHLKKKRKKKSHTRKLRERLLDVLCHVRLPTMHAGYIFIPLQSNRYVNVTCVSVMAEIPPLQTKREDAFRPNVIMFEMDSISQFKVWCHETTSGLCLGTQCRNLWVLILKEALHD